MKYDIPKFGRCIANGTKAEVYINIGLPQQTRKGPNNPKLQLKNEKKKNK